MTRDLTPDEFALELNLAAGRIQPAVTPVFARTAEAIAETQRERVPVGKTGELKDSIEATGFGGGPIVGPEADIGAKDFKAHWIEYGTVKTPPQPFVAQSAAIHVPRFVVEVAETAADVIRGRR